MRARGGAAGRGVAAGGRGARATTLPAPLDRRVRHVITENRRVRDTAAALARGDLAALPGLFVAAQRSMRDDFEASDPAVDHLVAVAIADPAVLAARLTGGGFGGSIVALARAGAGAAAAARIVAQVPAARVVLPEAS